MIQGQTASPSTLADDATVGAIAWINPTNAGASDGSDATASLTAPSEQSHYLKATNFGFSIPRQARIVGIQVEVEQARDNIAADLYALMVRSDTVVGTNRATGLALDTADTYRAYGGSTDLWGVHWTPEDINGSTFGCVFAIVGNNTGVGYVDHIRIRVYYELGAKAVVTVHEDFPPFRALAELPTAGPIDRVNVLSGARGRFDFQIAADDPNATADIVREGRLVVVRSTMAVETYVGRIERIADDPASRTVALEGDNLAALLYERQLPSDSSFEDQTAGAIAMQLLHLANTSNPTGIWPSPASEPGLPVEGTVELSGIVLGRALDQLADLTGDEWWLEHVIERNRLEVFLRWGRKRGSDKSASVHLQESIHFADAGYNRDALGYTRSVAAIGGGASIASRPVAVRTPDRPEAYPDRASVVERSSDEHARAVALTPSLAREVVQLMPLDTDAAVLADAAGRLLEQSIHAAESFDITVNTVLSWGAFRPGDIIRIILHSARLGDAVSRRVRVLAMQPDEADGEMDLAVELET